MQKGVILINAYLKSNAQREQVERLQASLYAQGIQTDVLRNDEYTLTVDEDGEIRSTLPKDYAFGIYLDKDKYRSQMLEKTGLRLFNRHEAILDCDDKMLTYLRLLSQGIPLVKTVAGLLCYEPTEPIRLDFVEGIERELGYPVVVKESFGSLGKNVFLANDRASLVSVMEKLKCRPHIFQRAVQTSMGKDIRVIVVGGKALGGMLRQSHTDFRSNIELGGTGTPYPLNAKLTRLCQQVAKCLRLDYCGIDVLLGEEGEYLICEVNSNAFFGGFERATGIDVAESYAKHIQGELCKK